MPAALSVWAMVIETTLDTSLRDARQRTEELSRLSMEQFTRPSITLSTLELLSSDHFYLQMGNFAPQMKRNFCKSGMKCKSLDFTKPSRESAELLWKISSKATFSNNSNWPPQFPILCPERMCLIAFHRYRWFLISGYIPSTNFWQRSWPIEKKNAYNEKMRTRTERFWWCCMWDIISSQWIELHYG